jgi:DNA-binding beta-propeller fold protein YncE
VYVANAGSDNVTVIDTTTGSKTTIELPPPAGFATNEPNWVAINVETNTVYVSNLIGANTTLINGATNAIKGVLLSGGGGWTAINPLTNSAYVIRYGGADEVNVIRDEEYKLTSGFRSDQPVGIAVNPVNERIYVPTITTGDVASLDMKVLAPYPPLLCPDGSGGFRPQPAEPPPPPTPDPYTLPCIDVANPPVAVAINPVTNRIYALSDSATGQISVINGANHTFTPLTPSGGMTGARTIAVNPVSNKIYAAFSNGVVVIDGTNNTMTTIPFGSGSAGPVAIGINVLTGAAYIPAAGGNLLTIRANGTTSTIAIPAGANGIAVDPADNMVYVLNVAGGVTPVTGVSDAQVPNGITTTIAPLPGNTSASGGTINLSVTNSMTPAALAQVRKVYFRIGTSGPWKEATGSAPYRAVYAGLPNGTHTLHAFATNSLESPSINTDRANVPIIGNIASYTFEVTTTAAPQAVFSVASLAFGGQSMGTTSPPQAVTVTNIGSGTLAISDVAASAQFAQTHNCASLTEGATCTIQVTFNPAAAAGPVNSTVAVAGTLTVTSNGTGSPNSLSLAGTAEKSLVTHYYRSILGRAPDGGGKAFWSNEAARVSGLGANVNETWYAMAAFFFRSGEYTAFNRDNTGFVTDLYRTFFNRAPDGGGLSFWVGQINSGMPREVVLVSFMFSNEFRLFTQAIFGNTAARAEVDMVMDFYRGLLARLPDTTGFNSWVQQFRTAQCAGSAAVTTKVNEISSAFANGAEYTNRNRSNAQYVGDLYNAFMRRGGDAAGVQHWINQLDTGAMSRNQLRQTFMNTAEFKARINAVIAQGCLQ